MFTFFQIDLQTEEAKETEGKILPTKLEAKRTRETSAQRAKTVEVGFHSNFFFKAIT